jgi:hypothetical protein
MLLNGKTQRFKGVVEGVELAKKEGDIHRVEKLLEVKKGSPSGITTKKGNLGFKTTQQSSTLGTATLSSTIVFIEYSTFPSSNAIPNRGYATKDTIQHRGFCDSAM